MNRLDEQIDHLRASLRRWTLYWGLGWTGVVCLLVAMTLGSLDFAFRWNSEWARWLVFGLLVFLTLLTLVPFLVGLLFHRISRLEVALRIEQHQLVWRGDLAALVGLTHAGLENPPSQGLPRSLAELEESLRERGLLDRDLLQEQSILETRRLKTPWRLLAVLLVIVLGLCLARPVEALIAADRLFRPWSDTVWPRDTILEVLNSNGDVLAANVPVRVVANQPLQLYVRDRQGLPPAELKVSLQQGSDRITETLSPTRVTLPDGTVRQMFSLMLTPDRRQMYFRASAGDDLDMPWFTVIGSTPPRIVSARTVIQAPAYLNKAEEAVQGIPARLAGLAGTKLLIHAEADRPLADAGLSLSGQPARSLSLDGTRKRFTAEIDITSVGRLEYSFQLRDSSGISESQPPVYEYLASEDRLPQVAFESPQADLQVTPQAILIVRIVASDDHGLGGMKVELASEDGQTTRVLEEFPLDEASETAVVREVTVNVSELGAQVGDRFLLRASAVDRLPEENRLQWAPQRRLSVVTVDDLKRDLAARQASLSDSLIDLSKREAQLLQTARQLNIQQQQAGQLRTQDLELLAGLQEKQQALLKSLDPAERGVINAANLLFLEYSQNQLSEEPAFELLKSLIEELGLLKSGSLGRSADLLGNALKRLDESSRGSNSAQDVPFFEELRPLVQELTSGVESLNQLSAAVEAWKRRSSLSDDLNRVIAEFRTLQTDTITVGQRTLAFSVSSLNPQDRAELAKLAERQREIGNHVQQLGRSFREASETQPYLQSMAQQIDAGSIAAQLVQSADQIERNNIGEVVTAQTRIAEELQSLEKLLKGSTASTAETLLKKVSTAVAELQTFRVRHSVLEKMWQDTEHRAASEEVRDVLNSVQEQQGALSLEIGQLARSLRLDRIEGPGTTLDAAARQLHRARELLSTGRTSRREVSRELGQFEELLNQAQQQLEETRARLELESAAEWLWNLAGLAEALAGRQQGLADEVLRLEGIREERGRLSRAELSTLQQTALSQESLGGEVQSLSLQSEPEGLLRSVLGEVSQEMSGLAELLRQRQTGQEVIQRQQAVVSRLQLLAESVKESLASRESEPSSQEPGPEGKPTASAPRSLAIVAELRLLLHEQERLLQETSTLVRQELPEADQKERARQLSERQEQLTIWFARLLSEPGEVPE